MIKNFLDFLFMSCNKIILIHARILLIFGSETEMCFCRVKTELCTSFSVATRQRITNSTLQF
uniref:Uncharacterized protein n=1 Tax=Anguilla anguilla TaxID=7936 RepID=A0A0E9S7T3_ANGAN